MTPEWIYETLGNSTEPWKYRNMGLGCSSLKSTATRVLQWNVLSITSETLAGVPWEIVKDLWWFHILTPYVKAASVLFIF